jgi:LysM repeat protein
MGAQPAPNPARLLAPVALAVFGILFFVVILSSGSSDSKKTDRSSAPAAKRSTQTSRKTNPRTPSTYTVKIGDNLPAIARKTGVSSQRIQELNPELDPYGLQGGQKIKLRE